MDKTGVHKNNLNPLKLNNQQQINSQESSTPKNKT